jgi:hypothetical protein
VRLIPHHRLGESKYEALGWSVPVFPGSVDEQMEKARRTFGRRCVRILDQA